MYLKCSLLFLTLWVGILKSAVACNYYLSSKTGKDSYTPTQAQNPLTPWRSIKKLDEYFRHIKPGDFILLKRGDVFTDSLLVTQSGTPGAPITISCYGTGALPVITLPTVEGWKPVETGLYKIARKIWVGVSIIYEDGIPMDKMASNAKCLDGNWWADTAYVYYRPSWGTILSHKIKIANVGPVSSYYPGVDLSDCAYVTIDGLEFDAIGYGIKTFDTSSGTLGIIIQNSIFRYCRTGILMMPDKKNNTKTLIKNCVFYRNQCAINMYTTAATGGRPAQTHGTNILCEIKGNEFSENGITGGKIRWAFGTDYEAVGLQNFMNGKITNNFIHDGFQIGIIIYNTKTRSSDNNVISKNKIINNHKGGLIFQGDDCDQGKVGNYSFNNNFIANNLFVNSAYTSNTGEEGTIYIYQGKNTREMNYFVNNTLYGNLSNICFPTSRSPFFTIENNIIATLTTYRFVAWFWANRPPTLTMDYNIYMGISAEKEAFIVKDPIPFRRMQSYGFEPHGKIADPLFFDIGKGNFHLQTKSPAINAGINVGLAFYGKAPDIGAFEYSP